MAKKRQSMSDNELLGIIGQYEKSALGSNTSTGPSVGGQIYPQGQNMTTLEIDRYNALNAYMGRPLGNEVEGRSQVVLPELRDTIEWVMPQLMRMFAATDTICRFEPEDPEDEEQSELESRVINYLFMKRNDGFFVLHDFIKDALILRNGYAKVWYEDEEKTGIEEYTGLTEIELAQLLQTTDELEILEQREVISGSDYTGQMIVAEPVYDIKLRRTTKKGHVKVECVPGEETLVSPQARHALDDCPFVEHKREMTRSDVIEMGYDRDLVDSISIGKPDWLNLVSLARDEVVDQLSEDTPSDSSMQEITVRTAELRVDYDGDGVAELRRVIVAGDKILDNYEIEEMSLVSCSPMRMPHRHVGISYYDLLNDLQTIKTTLLRQGLDNLYLANNQRTAVNEQNVNIEDLLVSRPGGIVRVNGSPGDNIMPMPSHPGVMQQVIPALEYADYMREMRTGIGKDTMGVDADALQDVTKGGQLAAMSAAALKVEMVARLLAEGIKDIFRKMHAELRRHQDKPLTVQLTGKWQNVNPGDWRERTAVSVNVGLGSGNREEARANLVLLSQMQEKIGQFGLIGPKQAYETFKYGATILGFENPSMYAMDPDSEDYQKFKAQHPPQVPPNVQVAQIKAQIEKEKAQNAHSSDIIRLQQELAEAEAKVRSADMKAQAEVLHAQQTLASQEASTHAQIDSEMAQTLVKVIGSIVAQQLKQNPAPNAGQVLAEDYQAAEGAFE